MSEFQRISEKVSYNTLLWGMGLWFYGMLLVSIIGSVEWLLITGDQWFDDGSKAARFIPMIDNFTELYRMPLLLSALSLLALGIAVQFYNWSQTIWVGITIGFHVLFLGAVI